MREIKFRAWDGYNKVMKYYTLKELADYDKFSSDTEFEAIQSGFDNWEWMQYTGLKDKKGKDIYEGDILRSWYSRDTTGKDIIYMIFPVEHETVDYKGFSGFQIEFLKNASIIGTIYENPDLLNSDTDDKRSVARKAK